MSSLDSIIRSGKCTRPLDSVGSGIICKFALFVGEISNQERAVAQFVFLSALHMHIFQVYASGIVIRQQENRPKLNIAFKKLTMTLLISNGCRKCYFNASIHLFLRKQNKSPFLTPTNNQTIKQCIIHFMNFFHF